MSALDIFFGNFGDDFEASQKEFEEFRALTPGCSAAFTLLVHGLEQHLGRLPTPEELIRFLKADDEERRFILAEGFGAAPHIHLLIQHRDGKVPWCNFCGLDMKFKLPVSMFKTLKD